VRISFALVTLNKVLIAKTQLMKKEFDDDWEDDLSGYKVISIEDLNKGFVGDKNALGDHIITKPLWT